MSSAALAVSPEPSSQTIHQCVDANTVEMVKSPTASKALASPAPGFVLQVDGTLSHQMKRFVIDGNKVVLNKPTPESKVEDCTFEENEVCHQNCCSYHPFKTFQFYCIKGNVS